MTLVEMQPIAQETHKDFIQMMPDVPFTEDDMIIEFAPHKKMAERAKALCDLYVPEKIINDSQALELKDIIGVNELIGRKKAAILVCKNSETTTLYLREIMFRELSHILCVKYEMNGERFIDIYGSGNTPDENPENKVCDGRLTAGYVVWSECIAQYYALKYVNKDKYSVNDLTNDLLGLLSEVNTFDLHRSKRSFAMVCSYLFICDDIDVFIELLDEPDILFDDSKQGGSMTREAFKNCLLKLHSNMQKGKPWKITKDFIEELGTRSIMFAIMNSVYLGILNPELFGERL